MSEPSNATLVLIDKLEAALDYAALECDMPNTEAVGCLVVTLYSLLVRCTGEDDDTSTDVYPLDPNYPTGEAE